MKSTGIVRKLDTLGRLVLPSELRRTLKLNEGDAIEIFVDGDKIILKKYEANNQCVITGEVTGDNKEISGLVFSPAGAALMIDAIESRFGGK